MKQTQVILTTADGRYEFEVDEFSGRHYVFVVSKNFMGGRQTRKIGDASTMDDALVLARVFTGKPVTTIITNPLLI